MPDWETIIKDFEHAVNKAHGEYYDYVDLTVEDADKILKLLREQEAVKSRKGQWVPIESPTGIEAFGIKEMTVMNVRCSVCGSEEDVSFIGYKYCPRCGAKMRGR